MTLLVALAGGLGAAARFLVDGAIADRSRLSVPIGTLVVNVLGSFLLGALTGWSLGHAASDGLRAVLGTGFLGGFTTFSTASVELVRLARAGRGRAAVLLAVGMIVASLVAAGAGLALTR